MDKQKLEPRPQDSVQNKSSKHKWYKEEEAGRGQQKVQVKRRDVQKHQSYSFIQRRHSALETSVEYDLVSKEITSPTESMQLSLKVVSNNSEDMITHLSCPKQAEESTGEEERCPEAPILFIYPKEACGQSALETSVEYDLVSKEITSPTESMQLSLK
ncbi:LOW QUALITY PROTEIN: hypothetical protein HID58_093420, partial [Brassica napus]